MSLLSMFGDLIQRPQSALTGGVLGLARDFGYRDPRTDDFHPGASTPWQGLVEGATSKIHPHELIPGDNRAAGIAGVIADLGVDPLLMLGGAAQGGEFGAKAGGLAEKAFSAGHVAEGDSKLATLLARGARRTIQGTLAAGGDPVAGLGLGMVQGAVENGASRIAPRLAALFGSHIDDALRSAPEIADTLADVPSAIRLNPKDFIGSTPSVSGPLHAAGTRDMTSLIDDVMSGGNRSVGTLSRESNPIFDLTEGVYSPAERAMADAQIAKLREEALNGPTRNLSDLLGERGDFRTPARAAGTRDMNSIMGDVFNTSGASGGGASNPIFDLSEGVYTPAERAMADAQIANIRGIPTQAPVAKPQSVSEMINEMYGGRKSLPTDELADAFMRILRMSK